MEKITEFWVTIEAAVANAIVRAYHVNVRRMTKIVINGMFNRMADVARK